jgi:cell division protein FtsB
MTQRRKVLWIALGVAGALSLVSVADARGFRRYFRLQQDIRALEERNRLLREQNGAMVREVEALRSDPRALERAAREELRFIKPGEVVFNLE